MSCGNNFKQIGLALHNYHAAYNNLPKQQGGTYQEPAGVTVLTNQNLSSWLVGTTPFMEQQALWEAISNPFGLQRDLVTPQVPPFPAMGPRVWNTNYAPWLTQIPTLRCPSDPLQPFETRVAYTNYAACLGDTTTELHNGGFNAFGNSNSTGPAQWWGAEYMRPYWRGAFIPRNSTSFKDVLDGLSNTIAAGEIVTGGEELTITGRAARDNAGTAGHGPLTRSPNFYNNSTWIDPQRPRFWVSGATPFIFGGGTGGSAIDQRRGTLWSMGAPLYTGMNTIVPPNGYVIARGANGDGIFPPSSHHQGGCHILMLDGAVKFVTDSIDAGNQSVIPFSVQYNAQAGEGSPYGLWGKLGTRSSSEVIDADF